MRAAMVLLLCLSFPAAAFAWGEEGHAIIAEIAQRRLSPQAAAIVEKLLGHGHSLASIASWADDFGANGTPEGTKTKNWHFVNIPIEQKDYDEKRDCSPNETYGDCIVAELNRLKNELHCTTEKDEGQVRALKFAVHFVGDIHQPLHTVKDLGGANGFEVGIYMEGVTCKQDKPSTRYKCSPLAATDLHTLWDSTLIQRKYWSWGKYVDDVENGWLTSKDAQGVDGGTPQEWAVESHAKAQEIWAMTPQPAAAVSAAIKSTVLDDEYLDKAIAIISRQLGLAGLRLARLLNEAYASCAAP